MKPQKALMSLDIGIETGFAIGTADGTLCLSGVKKFKKKKSTKDPKSISDNRFHDFYAWLKFTVEDALNHGIDLTIVVEKANSHMPGFDGVVLHFGFHAMVKCLQSEYNNAITLYEVPAMSIKKFWLEDKELVKLRGTASKSAMVHKTQELYPSVENHNESDAIALFHLFSKRING